MTDTPEDRHHHQPPDADHVLFDLGEIRRGLYSLVRRIQNMADQLTTLAADADQIAADVALVKPAIDALGAEITALKGAANDPAAVAAIQAKLEQAHTDLVTALADAAGSTPVPAPAAASRRPNR